MNVHQLRQAAKNSPNFLYDNPLQPDISIFLSVCPGNEPADELARREAGTASSSDPNMVLATCTGEGRGAGGLTKDIESGLIGVGASMEICSAVSSYNP